VPDSHDFPTVPTKKRSSPPFSYRAWLAVGKRNGWLNPGYVLQEKRRKASHQRRLHKPQAERCRIKAQAVEFSAPSLSSVHFVDFFGDVVEAEDDLVGFSAGGVRGESKRAIFDNM
jgi:hypothetical protein